MTWMDLTQLVLLILACVACYFRGMTTGVQDALDFCVREKLVDQDVLNRKLQRLGDD